MRQTLSNDYAVIEHALQHLMWAEQKKFGTLLAEHELTLPQFLVLVSIHRLGNGCHIGKLAEGMFQSAPTMTDLIDRLEVKKLVVREHDAKDRRKVVVELTGAGQRLLDRAMLSRRERLTRALSKFSARDRSDFLRLLNAYLETLEKEVV